MRRLPSGYAAALLLAAACSSDGPTGNGPTGPEPLLEQLPRPLSAAEQRLVDAGNQFTFDLFRQASRSLVPDSNAFLSPLSVSMALGMTLNGARGETFDSVRAALRFGEASQGEINQGYHDLLDLLVGLDRSTEVVVANSVWSDNGFPMRPEFVTALRTWFDAEARSLDFKSPAALDTINGWVNDRTRGRIPTLLNEIQKDEVAFLINAIYFKGRWRAAFDAKNTRPRPFHSADGTTRDVQTMSLTTTLRYARGPVYQAVDLLYGNGAFAMTVLLPDPGATPAELLAALTPAAWRDLSASFRETKLVLELPRFRLDYTRSLKKDLTALGMGIAFDPDSADFSGIGPMAPYLTRVLQKSFVEVNEEGTEAAAATAVGISPTSAPPGVTVDRPFLFAIRERFSEAILFIGLVNLIP